MIISNLTGGLGNQMFQYAAGRSLAMKLGADLKLHFTDALMCTSREYSLDCFDIKGSLATTRDLKRLGIPTSKIGRILLRISQEVRLRMLFPKITFESEKDPNSLFTVSDNTYLIGYWQNPKYFTDIEKEIRRDFTFINSPSKKSEGYIGKIKNTESISLHIRRGDYVTNKKLQKDLDICDIEYFEKSILYFDKHVNNPVIFVFSDDIGWAKENIRTKNPIYFVDKYKGKKDYDDMRLMSLCKHNIIANSSFSWWSAWLNSNPEKIVVLPKKWIEKKKNKKYQLPGWNPI